MTMTAAEFKAIRLANNLTQKQLAGMIGKERQAIIRYEETGEIPFLVEFYMRNNFNAFYMRNNFDAKTC